MTSVRDLGDHRWAVVERARSGGGGSTVVAAGPPITSQGGHCASMGGEVSGGPEAMRAAVRERVDRGAAVVKIMASGGVMTPGTDVFACQFGIEELRAAVDEAYRSGLPVAAHAHALSAVEQCFEAGSTSWSTAAA